MSLQVIDVDLAEKSQSIYCKYVQILMEIIELKENMIVISNQIQNINKINLVK